MPEIDFSLVLVGPYHQMLINGLILSLKLLGTSLIFALLIGTIVALLRLAPNRLLRAIGSVYVELVRNIPLLAQMLFWYFGAPELLPEGIRTWLYEQNIEAISAIAALSFYSGAYMAEEIRSGIRSVPKVQFEAGRALGFSFYTTMRQIILPQAIRIVIPPLISQTLNLWKDTSIATVIGAAELMYQTAQVESATFRSTEAFVFATAAYLTVSLIITGLASWYQQRYPSNLAT